jgi:hypothetical protein
VFQERFRGRILSRSMFADTKPIDWVMLIVEVAVLLLILYEVVMGELRNRNEHKRRSRLIQIVTELSNLLDKGLRMQGCVPDPQIMNQQTCEPWLVSVREWTEQTNKALAKHSPRAAAAFMLVTDAEAMDSSVHAGGRIFFVTGHVREVYQRFVVQMANLRRIVEQPEAYF